ncbi:MAG: S8 family serine peptidase, partial [Candidatus Thorarchaeota archaeon]
AGTGNCSGGVYAGVAPGATLISAKVTFGGILAAPSWIVSGIEGACSRGADIILMPFNVLGAPGDVVTRAVQLATQKGVLVVAAAGDDGPDYLTIMSPGASVHALTVGAYDMASGEIPRFSGRGPTFEMMAKPDIVAPGMGVIGARAGVGLASLGVEGLDLEGLSSISELLGGQLGESIDDYYVVADTTVAAAAIVAGAAAILIQAFDRAMPIAISNALRDTATQLPYGANDAGAGLINVSAAFDYLRRLQSPVESHARTTGVPLLAMGIVSSSGQNSTSTVLMSSYGTMTAVLDERGTNDAALHLLLGMFSLGWNNVSPTNLMLFTVKREFHQVHLGTGLDDYNRYVGILYHEDGFYVILLAESYSRNNILNVLPSTGLKVSIFVNNVGLRELENVTLYVNFSVDIFTDGLADHGRAAIQNNMLFCYGISEDLQSFYFGFNSSMPMSGFDVGNSSAVSDNVARGRLTNSPSFDGQVGLAAGWRIGSIGVRDVGNLTLAVGFGENRSELDSVIAELWQRGPSFQMQQRGDLIVVESDMRRQGAPGDSYESRAVVMNVGLEPSSMVAAFLAGRIRQGSGTVYSSVSSLGVVKPFRAVSVVASWRPEFSDVYSVAWVVGTGLQQVIELFGSLGPQLLQEGLRSLDDFLNRDVFVVDPLWSVSIFPKQLPCAPFDLLFPADFGMYGVVLYSTRPLGGISVTSRGNATLWGNLTVSETVHDTCCTSLSLTAFVPAIVMDGNYRCDYEIVTGSGYTTRVVLDTRIRYPVAMILLDTSHSNSLFGMMGSGEVSVANASGVQGGISLQEMENLGAINDIMESLRLSKFSALYEMKRRMASVGLDLIEMPGGGLKSETLSQFSGIIIVRPTREYNSTEIQTLRDFTNRGGRLVIFGDHDGKANITALNPLLSVYGYRMAGQHDAENTTDIATSSELADGISCVWLGGGTYVLNNQSQGVARVNGIPVILMDKSPPRLVLFGSSSLFTNTNLPRCDNSRLLENLNDFFLENTLIARAQLTEQRERYPVGKSVYLSLRLTDIRGHPVNDLFVAVAFELPNGSLTYFFAAFVENGLYASQFMPSYYRDEGRVNCIFIVLTTAEYAGTFASTKFWLYVVEPPPQPPPIERILTMPQVAIIVSSSIFGVTTASILANRRRLRRQLRIPEVDLFLGQDIDNTMNKFLAAFVQMEGVIRNEDLDRVQKVESLRAMMKMMDDAKRDFKRISKRVGGV